MSSKLNISMILHGYICTLKDQSTGRYSAWDIFLFLITPVILSVVSFQIGVTFNNELMTNILTASSIFAGLLFNLLLLVYDLMSKQYVENSEGDPESKILIKKKNGLLKEFYSIISYLILSAVIIIFICVTSMYLSTNYITARLILSSILMALGINFLLTLLMALKRTYILLREVNIGE